MRKWYKASIALVVSSAIFFLVFIVCWIKLDNFISYGGMPVLGGSNSVSIPILLTMLMLLALAFVALCMGEAGPVLERELLGKKPN